MVFSRFAGRLSNFGLPRAVLRHHIAAMTEPSPTATQAANPFFEPWATPVEVPPFSRIASEHFLPAFERGFAEHDAQVEAVAAQANAATFANTIEMLERGGR